ncbi:MAG: CRISPR-associated endonuclease Cas6 [Myxococcales bacterium]
MTSEERVPTHAAFGRFHLDGDPVQGNPQQLAALWRGAVASLFPAETAFHGHDGVSTVARYPEAHYRWIDGSPALFATGAAAQHAMAHPWPGVGVRLGTQERRVVQVDWNVLAVKHAFSRRLVRYDFGAPWIALNQENHVRYCALGAAARRTELDRILVGNLLTMSQGFGWFYTSEETVVAAFEPKREVSCVVKKNSLIGFEGSFVTNLDLPDDLAVGRSVSHGFGWFRACR